MNHEQKLMWMEDLNQLISTLNALKESDRCMKRMFLQSKNQNPASLDDDGENVFISYDGEGLPFDPDASPYTFESVYPMLYHDDLQNGVLTLKLDFPWEPNPVDEKKGNVVFKRYIIQHVIKENLAYKLSGDTDFNFKSWDDENSQGKYEHYRDKISGQEDLDPDIKNKAITALDLCKQLHHSSFNFSLMPVTGAMNNVKNDGRNGLDRLDQFLYWLNDYFAQNTKCNHRILGRATEINKKYLCNYLCYFHDIYDYCSAFYKMDRSLVDAMISSGAKPIESGIDVLNYMKLAGRYWKEREEYIATKLTIKERECT